MTQVAWEGPNHTAHHLGNRVLLSYLLLDAQENMNPPLHLLLFQGDVMDTIRAAAKHPQRYSWVFCRHKRD
jgi:hypothetical protein